MAQHSKGMDDNVREYRRGKRKQQRGRSMVTRRGGCRRRPACARGGGGVFGRVVAGRLRRTMIFPALSKNGRVVKNIPENI